jgi:pyruvate dehydrogenase E2 component (dihydrolipoamide acetyltransferase)
VTEITMPALSESMEEGTILTWLRADGDEIAVGDELVEIETDKATMSYAAEAAGVLQIVAPVGTSVAVGDPIATLDGAPGAPVRAEGTDGLRVAAQADADAAKVDPEAVPASAQVAPDHLEAPPPAPRNGSDRAVAGRATPVARRLARAHGVDLAALEGTGPGGRIVKSDVAAAAGVIPPADVVTPAAPAAAPAPAPSRAAVAPPGGTGAKGEVTTVPLTRLQHVVARRMAEVKATVPEFQVETEVDMAAVLDLRRQLKGHSGDDPAPSLNDMIVKVCASALAAHPRANSSYRDGVFELYDRVNVGIAVAADDALVVPTIFDADQKSLGQIGRDARRLAARVRDGSITPAELSGGTFTVSNLGMFGMTAITPVINAGQAAILGVGAVREVLGRGEDGNIVDRQLLTLRLSCDHRILYGADASRFLLTIRETLERPLRLLL